jgi:hypothetical protein
MVVHNLILRVVQAHFFLIFRHNIPSHLKNREIYLFHEPFKWFNFALVHKANNI